MKKHLILTSLLAIVTTVGAHAETDVTFAGDYLLGDSSTANVATPLSGSSYQYTYTKSDNSTVTVAQNVDPVLSYFTYTDKDGNPSDLSVGGTELEAADFNGTSGADGTSVISNQTIAAGETISRDNYQYVNGKGETVTLGEAAQTFTETVSLSDYATVESVDVASDSTAPVLTGDMYSYTDPDTGAVYHLNATGTEWVDANNLVVTPDAGTAQEAARDDMVAKYTADQAAISNAKTTVDGYAAAEATAFGNANTVYEADGNKISALTANYGTYTTATGLLSQAQTAKAERQGDFNADKDLETAAKNLYNSPIETTISDAVAIETTRAETAEGALDGRLTTAESGVSANAEAIANETARATGVEGALDDRLTTAESGVSANAQAIANETARATEAENGLSTAIANEKTARENADTAIRGEFAAADTATLNAAKSYTESALDSARAFANAGDAWTLKQANAYTNKKVDTLEKNVSGGVAAATALSAVSVANVGKGEVSVGGGYGYYNNQSAVAFGAAMGLSDSWSVNAGAGIASGDKTQFSIRAGANYKFKMF